MLMIWAALRLLTLLLISLSLYSRQKTYDHLQHIANPPYIPWFTGSLLPYSAVNASPGHPVIAPYLGLTLTYGAYNDNWNLKGEENTWSINPLFQSLVGITDHIGFDLYAFLISNFKKGQTATHLQDTIVLLGFQIATDNHKSWVPDIRFTIQETFPTGNYQKLNPKKLGIDATGLGSFQTGFNLIAQKFFTLDNHFLILKWSLGYLFPAPVHVKGLNTYGGGKGTSGTISPGQDLLILFSGEYSLSQRWVIAFDTSFEYRAKSTFKGNPGKASDGTSNPIGTGPFVQITVSPEIEYNLSSNSGLLFSLWTTLFGRNSPAFASAVAAYYIAF